MGTTLHALIEQYQQPIPKYKISESWDHVCKWSFNKDYALMIALDNHPNRHKDWPKNISNEADYLLQHYAEGLSWFYQIELPESISNSCDRYQAMIMAIKVLRGPIRILFWKV